MGRRLGALIWAGALALSLAVLGSASVSIAGPLEYLGIVQDGVDGVDGLRATNHVTTSPDGRHVYATSESDHTIVVFARDEETGLLTFVEAEDAGGFPSPITNIRFAAVSPDGLNVYAVTSAFDELSVFDRDWDTGELEFVEFFRDGAAGVDGLDGASFIAISPDGQYVYVAAAHDDAISIFDRNASGRLAFLGAAKNGEDGIHLLDLPISIAITPDGRHMYAASHLDEAIVTLERDAATGALSFLGAVQHGMDGVTGIRFLFWIALSPGGESLYSASGSFSSFSDVVAFSREQTSGSLGFLQRVGQDQNPDLRELSFVGVSPEGQRVFVTSPRGNSLFVFDREPTGQIQLAQTLTDSVDGIDGLRSVRAVVVTPDGKHAYAAGWRDNALAMFSVIPPNQPPDCSGALLSLGQLWPPNHDFHQVSVEGVTDPDGDPITITITDVFQDEALNWPGSGNTCPDGGGVGTDTALLRGERNGVSDGRVYHVNFLAEDGRGGECSGTVSICHPHDQGEGIECLDQGPLFDSTGPCDPGNDADGDGLLDTEEVAIGTHLLNPDTDGDGATDAAELAAGSDPLSAAPEGLSVPVPSLPAWGWVLLAVAVIAASTAVHRRLATHR